MHQTAEQRVPLGRGSRRELLSAAGAGGLALYLAACGGTVETTPRPRDVGDDLSIFNYVLLLEHLEAGFYAAVIEDGAIADPDLRRLIETIASNESEHVDALAASVEQLGGTPVQAPEADWDEVISGGEREILRTAAQIENLGAAAYLGQVPRIQDPGLLSLALSIHSVEARHAAAINSAAGFSFAGAGPLRGSIPDGPFAEPLDIDAVQKELKPYLPAAAAEVQERPQ